MDLDDDLTVHLLIPDVQLLLEGLDAYEYWQLGDVLPRDNGSVFIPGDLEPELDPCWGRSP